MPSSVLDIITRHWRKDEPEAEAGNIKVTFSEPPPMRKRGQAVPMSYERRLASYGLRDASGPTSRVQTPAQRRRIRKKLGHASRRA
jgi:hypothetical protein